MASFLADYWHDLADTWVSRFAFAIPTAIGLIAVISGFGNLWVGASLVLFGVVLAQGLAAFKHWSPRRAAVAAVREELVSNRRLLHEWDADRITAQMSVLSLPSIEWDNNKAVLRQSLSKTAYGVVYDYFQAADRFNRERGTAGPDLEGLAGKLETADRALADYGESPV